CVTSSSCSRPTRTSTRWRGTHPCVSGSPDRALATFRRAARERGRMRRVTETTIMDDPTTLSFEPFWNWLVSHPNCILRAGTPDTVIYDDEDLHWHFGAEGDSTMSVQVLRGKRL